MKPQITNFADSEGFYALRSRAFQSKKIAATEFDGLITHPSSDSTTIFLGEEGYCPNALKLSWLLGDTIQFVTPHFGYRYRHDELSNTIEYPTVTAVDPKFSEWRDRLTSAQHSCRMSFRPAAALHLHKLSDAHDSWANTEARIEIIESALASASLVVGSGLPLAADTIIEVDVPALVMRDFALLTKVKRDYPEASKKLSDLLRKSRNEALALQDHDPERVLARIVTEIIRPGIEEIRQKQMQALKSQAVTSGIEFAGSIPLAFSLASSLDLFIAKLLGGGLGAILAKGANSLRKSFADLRGDPFYAAFKLDI